MVTSSQIVLEYCNQNVLSRKQIPRYDAIDGCLYVGELAVKRFRHPAPNQQLILISFGEQGWPYHIVDPLPASRDVCAYDRLANAVRRLNLHQQNTLVHFGIAESGTAVTWKIVMSNSILQSGSRRIDRMTGSK